MENNTGAGVWNSNAFYNPNGAGGRCPTCGYCPHCGRGGGWWNGTITCGGSITATNTTALNNHNHNESIRE